MSRKPLNILIFGLIFTLITGNYLYGQDTNQVQLQERDAEAIRCWLKSDLTEVRIGQTFALTLTCQVAETEYERVVPKEESLEPSVVSLSPYEVVEGWHYPDIKRDTVRFFQYRYRLRLVGEEFFGKEVSLPEIEIKYTIERSLTEGQVLDTRERTYVMPPLVIKIASLVPQDTKDIRDLNNDDFQTVKVYERKAYIAFAVAGVLFVLPFLMFLAPAVRSIKKWRKSVSNGTGFSNARLLRRMRRELSKIQKARSRQDWDGEAVGRVLTLVRIMGAIALSKQINQLSTRFESRGLEGQLKLRKGVIWPRKVLISSNLTPESASFERDKLDPKWAGDFLSVFGRLNDIRYSQTLESAEMDQLFYMTVVLLRRVRFSNLWFVKKLSAFRKSAGQWRPVWRTS